MHSLKKLPISAVVACFNEAHLIEACLQSVQFCQEVIVIDLGSSDDSVRITSKYATKTLYHPRLPDVSPIRNWAVDKTQHDWILFIDPDERIDPQLAKDIAHTLQNIDDRVAAISVPWQFYFGNTKLRGTFWGVEDAQKTILIHKAKVIVPNEVHRGYVIDETIFQIQKIKQERNNVLHHFWMRNYTQLYEKHQRYLKLEGEAKYVAGWRYNRKKQFKHFLTSFYDSFIIYKGWRNGVTGFLLSLFYAWYNFSIWNSLKKYQNLWINGNAN